MKKFLSILLIGILLIPSFSVQTILANENATPVARKLLVTAYYSPLPDQSFYIRGNYEADIRLNGRGTNGADGTEVFTGMLAAPKTYPFGTRIRIPGLGVGEVHDRGGAIIERADYDRIDIWMGRGEEGLARALNWGARMVEGEVYYTPNQVEPGLSFSSISPQLPESLVSRLQKSTVTTSSTVFTKPVESASPDEIKDLQVTLTLFGTYSGPIDGELSDATKTAIVLFQLEEGIVDSESSAGAGVFGPRTREALQEKIKVFNLQAKKESERLHENQMLLAAGLGKNASGEEVEALQCMLWELGYYHGPISRQYDEQTIDAVFVFQKDRGILNDATQAGAGYYGDQTHKALVSAVDQRIEKVKEYPKEMQTWIPVERSLPDIKTLNPIAGSLLVSQLNFGSFSLKGVAVAQEGSVALAQNLDLGDRGDAVLALQNILIQEGFLEAGLSTGYFGSQTQSALTEYQLKHQIITSKADAGAGRAGPKTREVLNG
ncbi:hypothetical protein COY07_05665 [Candidatus Peregrinibacteria bacterium CG_4_10_14_0_2_um_filter_43_11]|nr:MAG: hypothetical protein COY07_05665 [Candidatus Peregrinibacteria bacterium CG_4_10_14_0_2_um_filter_43_11]